MTRATELCNLGSSEWMLLLGKFGSKTESVECVIMTGRGEKNNTIGGQPAGEVTVKGLEEEGCIQALLYHSI